MNEPKGPQGPSLPSYGHVHDSDVHRWPSHVLQLAGAGYLACAPSPAAFPVDVSIISKHMLTTTGCVLLAVPAPAGVPRS